MKTKLDLKTAERLAQQWLSRIQDYCNRVEIAGSIRRRTAIVGDIDIVCMPKRVPMTDLLGRDLGERNLAHEELQRIVRKYENTREGQSLTWERGGDAPGKLCTIIVEDSLLKYAVDFYFATPEKWGATLLTRTGPQSHNIWLAERAKELGGDWSSAAGILIPGKGARIGDEEALIYSAIGMPYVEPKERHFIESLAHEYAR